MESSNVIVEYYSDIKKKEILPFAKTWMTGGNYVKWKKLDKDKYCMLLLVGQMWNLKQTNKKLVS